MWKRSAITKNGREGAKKRSFISLITKNNRMALFLLIKEGYKTYFRLSSIPGNRSQSISVPKDGYYHITMIIQ
jgi:hypothetical protein